MKTEIKNITPEIAKEMLKKNGMNRPLNTRHVNNLKNQMASGQWLFDGTPIKLNSAGQLLDGQHRLTALAESGMSFEFVVISGVPTESFKVMDTGRNRTAADSVAIDGVANSAMIADVARSLANYDSHKMLGRTMSKPIFISNATVYNLAAKHIEEINKSHNFCRKFKNPIITRSKLVAFHLLFSRLNHEDSDLFISKLCTGLDLDIDSPIYILRQKLIQNAMSKKKMSAHQKFALIAKAWNLFRKGKPVSSLSIPESAEFNLL